MFLRVRYDADHSTNQQSGACFGGEVPPPGPECGPAHAAQGSAGGSPATQNATTAWQGIDLPAEYKAQDCKVRPNVVSLRKYFIHFLALLT